MLKSTSRPIILFLVIAILCVAVVTVPVNAASSGWDYKPRMVHVPILMYHYVDIPSDDVDDVRRDLTVTPANFLEQVKWLSAQGYQSITPDQLMAALWQGAKLPSKPVMFTFDDGYASAWTNVTPVLTRYGYTGTFFVITDYVDQAQPGYLTWALARKMTQLGMSIQDHTATHEDMRNRSHEWYQTEIVASAADIQKQTGIKPRFFCYPSGGYDDVAIRELRAAGYLAAFTENDSRYEYASNTFRLPRVRIRGAMALDQFIGAINDNR